MKKHYALFLALCLACFTNSLYAEITLTFHGRVSTENAQNGLDDTLSSRIGIHSGKNATPVWSEVQNITFTNGNFSVIIGDPENSANQGDGPLEIDDLNQQNPYIGILTNGRQYFIPLTSIPYAIRASVAETAERVSADAIQSPFVSTMSVNADLVVSRNVFVVDTESSTLRISTSNASSKLNVNGVVNVIDSMFINGDNISDGLSWERNDQNTQNIGLPSGFLGIGTSEPHNIEEPELVNVRGVVNAQEMTLNGVRLSAQLDWQPSEANPDDLVFTKDDGRVGVGLIRPRQTLDISRALVVSSNIADETAGMIRRNTTFNEIEGFDGTEWVPITSVRGSGVANRIAYFTGRQPIDSRFGFIWNNANDTFGINADISSADAQFNLTAQSEANQTPIVNVTTSQNAPLFYISPTGNIGIRTLTPSEKVQVSGIIDASNYLLNGISLSLAVSRGSLWTLTRESNIFYNVGNVGIGRPDPKALLEIGQRSQHPDEDPAITFSSSSLQYTMGISHLNPDIFRIEKGTRLKSSDPLFVARDDRTGIGVENPLANLHVSGNNGMLLTGEFFGAIDETDAAIDEESGEKILPQIVREGPGTRFIWHPRRAAFRAGHIQEDSPLLGTEWNNESIGKFSVAFGLNNAASGNFSTILGGRNNLAKGAYATILGGQNNRASGDFTVAIGQNAYALNHGSFVWNSSSTTIVESNAESQFLLGSSGGIGINTAVLNIGQELQRTTLTIAHDSPTGSVLTVTDINDIGHLRIHPSGNITIGSTENTRANLSIMGPLHVLRPETISGNSNITSTNSMLEVSYTNPSINSIVGIYNNRGSENPAMVIVPEGHLAFGRHPRFVTDPDLEETFTATAPAAMLIATNTIEIDSVFFPDGTQLLVTANIPWQKNLENTIAYYTSGNVGIGTPRPETLLTLSNVGAVAFERRNSPVVTIDVDNTSVISFGIIESQSNTFRFSTRNILTDDAPAISIVSRNIGIGTAIPSQNIHVVGNTIIGPALSVSTDDDITGINAPTISVETFLIRREIVEASGGKWNRQDLEDPLSPIYKPASKLSQTAIGRNSADVDLHISGTINATSVQISNSLNVQAKTELNRLGFRSGLDVTFLTVEDEDLVLSPDINLTSFLSKGSSDGGPLTIWQLINGSFSEEALTSANNLVWEKEDNALGGLNINVSSTISNEAASGNSFAISNAVRMGTENILNTLDISSEISHSGLVNDSESFAAHQVIATITDWYDAQNVQKTNPSDIFDLVGLTIDLNNTNSTQITNQAKASGVYIDMSDVAVQSVGSPGFSASAAFIGDVGIETRPVSTGDPNNNVLDVKGSVIADNFIIGQRLSLSTINVQSGNLFVGTSGRVGIGTTEPSTDLDVIGDIAATSVAAKNAKSATLLINNGEITVNDSGFVGMIETTDPSAQWHLEKTFTNTPDDDINIQVISTNIEVDTTDDIHSLVVGIGTNESNTLGKADTEANATGISIDLQSFNGKEGSTAVGIYTNIPALNPTQNSAIFLGGNVGIGVTNPSNELHVKGTIRANKLTDINLLTKQESASFNRLVTLPNGQVTVKNDTRMNNLSVSTLNLTDNRLVVSNTIDQPNDTLNIEGSPGVLITDQLLITDNVTADTLDSNGTLTVFGKSQFSSMGIGTAAPESGLSIFADTSTSNHLIITDSFISSGITFTANDNGLNVSDRGRVGINTTEFVFKFGMDFISDQQFLADDNSRWNAIRIQNTSDDLNSSVGVILAVSTAVANNIGAGFVAQKTSANDHASQLIFITDPNNDVPTSALTITDSGEVLIGKNSPVDPPNFFVDGSSIITGQLSQTDQSITTNTLQDIDGLTIAADTVQTDKNIIGSNGIILTDSTLLLRKIPTPSQLESGIGRLFVTAEDHLRYAIKINDNIIASGNLDIPPSAPLGTIPYYNDNYTLSGDAHLGWVTRNLTNSVPAGRFIVGHDAPSDNIGGNKVEQLLELDNSILTDHTMTSIKITAKNRSDDNANFGDRVFSGLSVTAGGNNASLETNNSMVGLRVNMETLADSSQDIAIGSDIKQGIKYAALFKGGTIGIGTTRPSSAVHIVLDEINNAIKVDSRNQEGNIDNAFTVSASGNIGIGLENAAASLNIRTLTTDSENQALSLENATESVFRVMDNGYIGIRTSPNAHLDINDTVQATQLNGNGIIGDTLFVNTNGLSIFSNGNIGIGVTEATAQFHTSTTVTPSQTTAITANAMSFSLNSSSNINVVAADLSIRTDGNEQITDATIQGINLDATELALEDAATLTGVSITVSENNGTFSNDRIAAVFNGHVGIGLTNPSATLDINGGIKSNGDIQMSNTSDFEMLNARSNFLELTNGTFSQLNAESITTINVTGTLTTDESTGQFDQLRNAQLEDSENFRGNVAIFNQVMGINQAVNSSNSGLLLNGSATISTLNANQSDIQVPRILGQRDSDITISNNLNFHSDATEISGNAQIPGIEGRGDAPSGTNILYLSNADNRLHFIKSDSQDIDLTRTITGTSNRLPYYSATAGRLSSSSGLFWLDTLLHVGGILNDSGRSISLFQAEIPSTPLDSDIAHTRVELRFLDRPAIVGTIPPERIFAGTSIQLSGDTTPLQENEYAVGLRVNVTNLNAESSTALPVDEDTAITGEKYAALFQGGHVGIHNSNRLSPAMIPTAALTLINRTSFNNTLRVDVQNETRATENALIIDSGGYLGINTVSTQSRVNILASGNHALSLLNTDTTPLIGVYKVADTTFYTGVGSTTPTATLHINGNNTPIVSIQRESTQDIVIADNGFIGFSTPSPESILHTVGSLNIDIADNNAVAITTEGRVSLGNDAPTQVLSLPSSNILIGNSAISASADIMPSTIITSGNRFIQLGRSDERAALYVSSNRSLPIVIRSGDESNAVMTFRESKLGIGTLSPSESVHIIGKNDRAILYVESASNDALYINSDGQISIRSTEANGDIFVDGSVSANRFINAETGTIITVPTVNIQNTQAQSGDSYSIRSTITTNVIERTAQTIEIDLATDINNDITAYALTLSSINNSALQNSANPSPNVYGLKVDVSGVNIENPEFGTSEGRRFPAIFRGGRVGIGTLQPSADIHIHLSDPSGIGLSSGPIATIISTPNIVPGGSNIKQTGIIIESLGDSSVAENRTPVPTHNLLSIMNTLNEGEIFRDEDNTLRGAFFVTPPRANDLMQILIDNNVLDENGKFVQSTSVDNLISDIAAIDINGDGFITEYITTQNVIRALRPFIEREAFAFRLVTDNNVIDTPILFTNNSRSKRPTIGNPGNDLTILETEGNQFFGTLAINAQESRVASFDAALIVGGDVRVGIIQEDGTGNGSKVWFSGGPILALDDNENEDPMWIARRNTLSDESELQINVGEDNSSVIDARFVIGVEPQRSFPFEDVGFEPILVSRITKRPSEDAGINSVGIGESAPTATLHVKVATSVNEANESVEGIATQNGVLIENEASDDAQGLALQFTNQDVVGNSSNFITFTVSTANAVDHTHFHRAGSIEGNGSGGIQFTSPEADYAEFLPKRDPNEVIEPGQIVGIFDGKVSKITEDADQIMVSSVAPIILGNWQQFEDNMIPIAFLGQVKITIVGPVTSGDIILTSGKNDGTGIALAASKVTSAMIHRIVGQAWEGSDNPDKKAINTLVGFPTHYYVLNQRATHIQQIQTDISKQKEAIRNIEDTYKERLHKQRKLIEELKKEILLGSR